MFGEPPVADAWAVDNNGTLRFSCSGIPHEGKDLSTHPAFINARDFDLHKLSSAGWSIEENGTTCFFGLNLADKVILFPVSLSRLLDRLLNDSGIANVAHAWIIGPNGTFLFHSLHPELAGKDIVTDIDECKGCHQTFLHERWMWKEIMGIEQFKVSGVVFVAGFWTEQMFGEEWTVVVSAPIVDVPTIRRVEVWWLLTTIIVILLLATVAIYSVVTRPRTF